MLIHIQLVDDENDVHGTVTLPVEPDMSINKLQTILHSRFRCPVVNQVLTHQNGDLIAANMETVEEASITPQETLILKHSDLELWTTYRKLLPQKNFPNEKEMREKFEEISRIDKIMIESHFLITYLKFYFFRDEHYKRFSYLLSPGRSMKISAEQYFKSLYSSDGRRMKCRFKSPSLSMRGSHNNTLAYVYGPNANERRKFVLKIHNDGPYTRIRKDKRCGVDIMEVFGLKALELMGLGPKVHFIPLKLPEDSNEFRYLYHASEFRPDFQRLSDMKPIHPEVAIQLLLIKEIFFFRDLHWKNCGSWKNSSTAAIVDFSMDECGYKSIFYTIQHFYPSHDWADEFEKVLKRPDPNLYSRVEYYLNIWDVDNVIDKALKETEAVVAILEQHKTPFRCETPSDYINLFIRDMRENLRRLHKKLQKHNAKHTTLPM